MSNFPSVRPSLNLQFDSQPTPADMTSHLASVGATFSRASVGTYTDANGLVREATAGQARPNYSTAGVHEGLLIEESRTNLVTSSEDFSVDWTGASAGAGTGAVVTVNQAIAPDGTASADKIFFDAGGTTSSDRSQLTSNGVSVTLGNTYTSQIYLKGDSGGEIINIRHADGTTFTSFTLTTEWQKCVVTETVSTSTASRPLNLRSSGNNQQTATVYAWGAQLEEGSFPTSYIPTIPTFTDRDSVATFLGSDGLIQTASVDVARSDTYVYVDDVLTEAGLLLEGSAENLVTSSEDFSLPYVSDPDLEPFRVTVERNNIIAPDGTASADRIIETSDTGAHAFQVDALSNQQYTFSIFAKAGERDHIALSLLLNGTNVQGIFDLTNGTVTAFSDFTIPDSLGIEDYGNGWYRCYVVSNDNNTRASFSIAKDDGTISYAGDTTKGLYVWGAQIEAGSQPTSYFPTERSFDSRASSATFFNASGVLSTASTNVARTDHKYIGGQWVEAGLLLEGASTNELFYSEEFNHGYYSKSQGTISANSIVAPDGTTTADTYIVDDGESSNSPIVRSISLDANTTYTLSLFVKRKDYDTADIRLYSAETGFSTCSFDLSDGTVSSGTIEDVGNGWYRVSTSMTTSSTVTSGQIQLIRNAELRDGTSGIYIWGAQLEEQSQATSYIPTSGATADRAEDVSSAKSSADRTRDADSYTTATKVRSADVCEITGTAFTDFYNQDEGTYFVKFNDVNDLSASSYIINSDDGTNDERVYLLYGSGGTGNLDFRVQDDGSSAFSDNIGTIAEDTTYNVAIRIKAGDYRGILDGTDVSTDTYNATPTITRVYIGSRGGGSQINGKINKFIYFPRGLSNNELIKLTQ